MADAPTYTDLAQGFTPAPEHSRDLRDAFGQFATGITVVTTTTAQGPIGMTVNSFASVSLDPALLLWCPGKFSSRYAAFTAGAPFAVHVLAADQEPIARQLAGDGYLFDGLDMALSPAGVPLIAGCLARFECVQHDLVDAGDHAIVIGRITRAHHEPGEPLLFVSGQYSRRDALSAAKDDD
ncbi:p-hydroxyphenylacetate 3-hydroxylase, reductase component [Aquimixticola soesokkakensis]|uniref:p-hydroxyphenylacetate 3-hydroxylase, reductase component n=1 Tax=Aquimixticola soesokkakensis TaxID=1519096 RepID=A0A1Y5TK78_9RHOB|nr:flavin reductase family protein [Aquimixticola soesokkakensis]SLN66253.1 p-hydroxyphenylacetate 3-hydroxylase, reductase component [Aquimixticola soesokkakensis]